MARRRRKARPSALTGLWATVTGSVEGFEITINNVNAPMAVYVLADLLDAFRALKSSYPELVTGPLSVGAYEGLSVDSSVGEEERRRLGFRVP